MLIIMWSYVYNSTLKLDGHPMNSSFQILKKQKHVHFFFDMCVIKIAPKSQLSGHMRLSLTLNFVLTIELCGGVIWSTFLSPQNKATFVIYFLIYN